MKEVSWRVEKIINRRNLDMEFNAKIHQMEIKTPTVGKEMEVSEEQEKNISAAIEAAKERKAKQYGR